MTKTTNTNEINATETYSIPECNLEALEEKIRMLNKKAVKLSCPPISYRIVKTEEREAGSGFVTYHVIEVTGESPVIGGWTFEGVVDFSDTSTINGYTLRTSPNSQPLSRDFRSSIGSDPGRCDHCGKHRYRKETFVIRNTETNEYHLVGRSCLKDFTGHANPKALAQYFEMIHSFTESLSADDFGCYGRTSVAYDIVDFIIAVVVLARLDGFVSRKASRDEGVTSTATLALMVLDPNGKYQKDLALEVENATTDDDRNKASAILEFALTMWADIDEAELSDYVLNLRNTITTGRVGYKTSGIVASIYACYERHLSDEAKKKVKGSKNSQYQGDIKERITFEATCFFSKWIDTYYGSSQLCKFADSDGNVYTWFNSGRQEVKINECYRIKGTVKGHSEFNKIKETQLTRCSLK